MSNDTLSGGVTLDSATFTIDPAPSPEPASSLSTQSHPTSPSTQGHATQSPSTGGASVPGTQPSKVTGGAPAGDAVYPLLKPPEGSWLTPPRFFGAWRSNGTRKHAGCDNYAPLLDPVRAIADGVVRLAPYAFYNIGNNPYVNALEVVHPGIGIVRYGEISAAKVVRFAAGERIKKGQIVGYIGQLGGGIHPMLHFELYSGTGSGQLTQYGNIYMRRSDLQNPTQLLTRLLHATFPSFHGF